MLKRHTCATRKSFFPHPGECGEHKYLCAVGTGNTFSMLTVMFVLADMSCSILAPQLAERWECCNTHPHHEIFILVQRYIFGSCSPPMLVALGLLLRKFEGTTLAPNLALISETHALTFRFTGPVLVPMRNV